MKKIIDSVIRDSQKLPLTDAEKRQMKKVFLTGAAETGLLSPDDAKRLTK